eukprot:11836912-Heterocapsa_arctica.AAC.1
MAIARMPEDRSKTFKNLEKPSKPYTPVCVHLQGPLTLMIITTTASTIVGRKRAAGRDILNSRSITDAGPW